MPDGCPLTPKQHETLLLVMRGWSCQQVAAGRFVTSSAVRSMLHEAYGRLGVTNAREATATMLRRGWIDWPDLLSDRSLPNYTGSPYATGSQRPRHTENWVPSPAQRLYLDAFDVLLRERSQEAAEAVDYAFGVLCWERGCPDRRDRPGRKQSHGRRARDVDELLLVMAHAVTRPISLAA